MMLACGNSRTQDPSKHLRLLETFVDVLVIFLGGGIIMLEAEKIFIIIIAGIRTSFNVSP